MKGLASTLSIAALLFLVVGCSQAKTDLTNDQVVDIAKEAYIFGYPLVLMDYTRMAYTNIEKPNDGRAPINQIGHFRRFPDHKFTDVVRPNVDTYYSNIFYDLSREPIVLSVPETDRYYLLPHLDAYSNVFFSPGPRTTGRGAQNFLIAGPFWDGDVPEGMSHISSPTNLVWMLGRTQVNSPEDGETVVAAIQEGYEAVPLSQFGKEYVAPKGVLLKEEVVPVKNSRELTVSDFFTRVAELMVNNPAKLQDAETVENMKSIGIVPGEKFDISKFNKEVQGRLKEIPEIVHEEWKQLFVVGRPDWQRNGWLYISEGMGSYGRDYDLRAFVAFVGLGVNLPEDAVYPTTSLGSNGELLSGENKYVIHFDKESIPSVQGFWSITAYNAKNFLIENPINRFAIGDRNDLKLNKDGSLDIYIQGESPGTNRESNWLPSTKTGTFTLSMRLYWGSENIVDRTWNIPAVTLVK